MEKTLRRIIVIIGNTQKHGNKTYRKKTQKNMVTSHIEDKCICGKCIPDQGPTAQILLIGAITK